MENFEDGEKGHHFDFKWVPIFNLKKSKTDESVLFCLKNKTPPTSLSAKEEKFDDLAIKHENWGSVVFVNYQNTYGRSKANFVTNYD